VVSSNTVSQCLGYSEGVHLGKPWVTHAVAKLAWRRFERDGLLDLGPLHAGLLGDGLLGNGLLGDRHD